MGIELKEIKLDEEQIEQERKLLEISDLNLPEKPGLAPQINWGQDFENFDDKRKIIYLKKLCSALNHAADLIQQERDELLKKCHSLNEQLKNSDNSVSIRKDIYTKAITDHNEEKQNLIKRLQELEKEIKLKNEILKSYGINVE